jgi:hypothetical protein
MEGQTELTKCAVENCTFVGIFTCHECGEGFCCNHSVNVNSNDDGEENDYQVCVKHVHLYYQEPAC